MLKRRNVFYFIPWPKLAKQGNNVNFTQLITLFTQTYPYPTASSLEATLRPSQKEQK